MSSLHVFVPRAEISASENLREFIDNSKWAVKIWSDIKKFNWDDNIWQTHEGAARFVKLASSKLMSSKLASGDYFSEPFLSFAKAYFRYRQSVRATKDYRSQIVALRFLEAALLKRMSTPLISSVRLSDFDCAFELLRESGYKNVEGIASRLQRISKDLVELRLCNSRAKFWSFKAERWRDASESGKLPSDDALLAVAEVFSNGFYRELDDQDEFLTSTACLLLSAPMRGGELVRWRPDFIREDKDKNGDLQRYFQYWSPKSGEYTSKAIPAIIADLSVEALRRLVKLTEDGRRLALHYENNSDRFYRHRDCPDVDEDQVLTPEQVSLALGYGSLGDKNVSSLVRTLSGSGSLRGWTLRKLWKVVRTRNEELNPYFPYQQKKSSADAHPRLKMSESLMCFRYRQLSTNVSSPVLLVPTDRGTLARPLANDLDLRGGSDVRRGFFSKHGYGDIRLRTHQLRHFLNTAAEEAGIGIEFITDWSTRASVRQTATYMHQGVQRKGDVVESEIHPQSANCPAPITEEEYSLLSFGPIHVTQYGVCAHDWFLMPCNKFHDCLGCSEHIFCKGHKRSIDSVRKERDKIQLNLLESERRIASGHAVVSRWCESHRSRVERLDQIIKVMEDPCIQDGSPLQFRGGDFSHEGRIVSAKASVRPSGVEDGSGIEYDDEVLAALRFLEEN